jgi:hypothetical protein
MSIITKTKDLLNAEYGKLDSLVNSICEKLNISYHVEFYNGHFSKDKYGNWTEMKYPIPVINIQDLCDIEVDLDVIGVSTRISKEQALKYDWNKLLDYDFEVHGIIDFLSDYHLPPYNISDLQKNIRSSEELEIGVSFNFLNDGKAEKIIELIEFLKMEPFYI